MMLYIVPGSIVTLYDLHLCHHSPKQRPGYEDNEFSYMFMFANNVFFGGGVRVRVEIREQRKIKRRSKGLLSL